MKRFPVIIIAASLMVSCSLTYMTYRENMFQGINYFRGGEYQQARTYFMKAVEARRDAKSLAFAAAASYKMNDLTDLESQIVEAESIGKDGFSYLRIAGYRALIFLKEGKKPEGMAALKDYIDVYSRVYPMPTIKQVEDMWIKDRVDLTRLEQLIEEQVSTYEWDIDQYLSTGTGWYGRYRTPRLR